MPVTCLHSIRLLCLALLTLIFVAGCSSAPAVPTVSANDTTPAFTLKLRAHTADHRFTYFEVDKQGAMRFGGGREAAFHESKPDITLTPEQRAAVWQIITEQHVAETESFAFADFKTIEYRVDIWAGKGMGRSFRTIDDKSPGVKALHDLLFKYHLDANVKLPGLPMGEK
jgi:hypothetical protein